MKRWLSWILMVLWISITVQNPCDPVFCLSCTGNGQKCSQCATGYYKSSTSCIQCPYSACSSCFKDANCSSCVTDYYQLNRTCIYCGDYCTSCATTVGCTACQTGYYFTTGVCHPCPTGCGTCSSLTSCTSCTPDYSLSGTSCQLIPKQIQGSVIAIALPALAVALIALTIFLCYLYRMNRSQPEAPRVESAQSSPPIQTFRLKKEYKSEVAVSMPPPYSKYTGRTTLPSSQHMIHSDSVEVRR